MDFMSDQSSQPISTVSPATQIADPQTTPANISAGQPLQNDDSLNQGRSRRQRESIPTTPDILTPETITESPTSLIENSQDNTNSVESTTSTATENEPAKELEPEVEKMVDRIHSQKVQAPEETVIGAESIPDKIPKTVSEPVVVLPLSEAGMKKGKSKNSAYSIRWLYEWCVRQIRKLRKFVVVYRE